MSFLGFFLQADDAEGGIGMQNIISVLTDGGILGMVINVILLILSIFAVYIFFERYFTIKKATRIDESFMNNIRAAVTSGNIAGAKAMLAGVDIS